MSNCDQEEVPLTNWFDSESDFPEISSVNSTLELGVIVSSPSVNAIQVKALEVEDSSAMGPAPNKGNPVGHAPLEGTESCKGVNFLDTLIHTPPQSKSLSSFSCHRGWIMGRGRGVGREGLKSSTLSHLRKWSKLPLNGTI